MASLPPACAPWHDRGVPCGRQSAEPLWRAIFVGPVFVGPGFVGPGFVGPGFAGPGFVGPAGALDDATAEARERVVALATGSPKQVTA